MWGLFEGLRSKVPTVLLLLFLLFSSLLVVLQSLTHHLCLLSLFLLLLLSLAVSDVKGQLLALLLGVVDLGSQ